MNVWQKLAERSGSLEASKGKERPKAAWKCSQSAKCKVQLQRSVQNAPAPLRNGIVESSFEEQVPARSPRQEGVLSFRYHFHMDGP